MSEQSVSRAPSPHLCVRRLGLVEYADGLTIQSAFRAARQSNVIADTLLLVEHPHVLTVGRAVRHLPGGVAGQLLASPDALLARKVEVFETDRGGAVTYHGPGQIVAYPILKLDGPRRDVHRFLRDLEEVMIRTLRDFEIGATRRPGLTGVWVSEAKIASIGVHISRWVTTHGLALNVNCDVSFFDLIHPCGLENVRMTSMEQLLGRSLNVSDVEAHLVRHVASVFESQAVEMPIERDSIQVIIRPRHNEEYLVLKRTSSAGGYWQPITGFVEPGESPAQAARREIAEETGLPLTEGDLVDLSYTHSFVIDRRLLSEPTDQPVLVREHSFAVLLERKSAIKLDPTEHEDYEFTDLQTALARVPWVGNRRAIEKTEQLTNQASSKGMSQRASEPGPIDSLTH